jgi:hypothetical protein
VPSERPENSWKDHRKKRKLPEKPSERHVCGGEVQYSAYLAPKNQKHPRPRVAVSTAEKSWTTTESPLERHVDGEEAPKPVDLQPKKRMNQNSHPQQRGGNHRDDDVGKDQNKPARSQAGREGAEKPNH